MIDSLTDRSMEMTSTVEEADLKKLQEVLCDIKIEECPWFEVHDKYGKSAKYYREKLPDKQLSNNSPKVDSDSGDLISRQDAISVASTYCHPADIVKELDKLPSAQPEIIRCMECAWYHVLIEPQYVEYCELTECTVFRNDFCSRAERKTYE